MITQINRLIDFYTKQLENLGLPKDRAFRIAKAQVEVHAFGITTHGLPPLNSTIRAIEKDAKRILPPQIIREFGALVTTDCSKTPNVEPILWGMDKASELGTTHGIGFVSLLNGGWVGTMGYHLSYWAKKGFLMMAWNQTSNILFVNAFGGKEPVINTNPLAFSFPLSKNNSKLPPLVADFSTSATSMGKTIQMIADKEFTKEKIYQTTNGEPSNDPKDGRYGGTIQPFGGSNYGFRGTSLALLVEAMTAAAGSKPVNPNREGGQNTHVLAINIEALGNLDEYNMMIEDMMGWMLNSTPIDINNPVRYPGQRGWKSLSLAREKGVTVQGYNLKKLLEMGFKE